MIDIRTIRLGNLIGCRGRLYKVLGLNDFSDKILLGYAKDGVCEARAENCNPIQLTTHHIESDFIYTPDGIMEQHGYTSYMHKNGLATLMLNPSFKPDDVEWTLHIDDKDRDTRCAYTIKYLHEYQNAMYDNHIPIKYDKYEL